MGKITQSIPGYYTLAEAAEHLGLSQSGAAKAAKAEAWKCLMVGNVYLYDVDDVREYRDHRFRTKLVKRLGWRYPGPGQGLYRADDIDIECPICGSFAVEWPAPPELSTKFMCLKGHEGELNETHCSKIKKISRSCNN